MTPMPAKSLLESYLDDESDAAQTAHVEEHLANCTSCAGVWAEFLELRAGIRPTHPTTVRPLASASAFRLPCARRIHKPPGEPPHWRWMTIAARHPAGGFGCTEYRSVPFAHFQPGSGRAGRLIKPRAIADGSTLLGRAVVRSAHGEAMVRWQAGLLADETKVENAPSPRTLASWHATRRGSPSFKMIYQMLQLDGISTQF